MMAFWADPPCPSACVGDPLPADYLGAAMTFPPISAEAQAGNVSSDDEQQPVSSLDCIAKPVHKSDCMPRGCTHADDTDVVDSQKTKRRRIARKNDNISIGRDVQRSWPMAFAICTQLDSLTGLPHPAALSWLWPACVSPVWSAVNDKIADFEAPHSCDDQSMHQSQPRIKVMSENIGKHGAVDDNEARLQSMGYCRDGDSDSCGGQLPLPGLNFFLRSRYAFRQQYLPQAAAD